MAPWALGTLVTFPFEAHENFSSCRGLAGWATAGLAHPGLGFPLAPLWDLSLPHTHIRTLAQALSASLYLYLA